MLFRSKDTRGGRRSTPPRVSVQMIIIDCVGGGISVGSVVMPVDLYLRVAR